MVPTSGCCQPDCFADPNLVSTAKVVDWGTVIKSSIRVMRKVPYVSPVERLIPARNAETTILLSKHADSTLKSTLTQNCVKRVVG